MRINLAQTQKIHALKRSIANFTDADYRAAIGRVKRGASSSKDLSFAEAGRLIDELVRLGGKVAPTRRASELVDGPYAPKLRALWMALWNLGAARSNDDRAIIAFVKRQSGVDHTRFLNDPAEAAKAIEALKSWLVREGVPAPALAGEIYGAKQAVARAVAWSCFSEGAFTPFIPSASFFAEDGPSCWPTDFEAYGYRNGCPAGFEYYKGADWDLLAARLGARLRAHRKARKAKKQEAA